MLDQPAGASPITVCTLWEKDHHKGVGTLVNSLVRAGYRGKVWAGFRGDLPPWAAEAVPNGNGHVVHTKAGVEVILVKLDISLHFAQYKAGWMKHVLESLAPDAEGVFYFDPDVFVLADWAFFERWLGYGIAACEDVEFPLNPTHPMVHHWRAYAKKLGYAPQRDAAVYLNSGLVGVSRQHSTFLDLWEELLHAIRRDFGVGDQLKTEKRSDHFYIPDQDAFTLATILTPHPISWVGPDGMAFERGEWLTHHAYQRKPWRRKILRDLLRDGDKPDSGSRLYWKFAGTPIQVEAPAKVRQHRWLLPLGAFLSRFYQRTGR